MLITLLVGCGARDSYPSEATAPTGPAPSVATRGSPVPPDTAQLLNSAPAGARVNYRLSDGRGLSLALGPVYDSGMKVPCRLGRAGSGEPGSGNPTVYAFCRDGNQWYQTTPVVISGD
jgi:hypothetical protein